MASTVTKLSIAMLLLRRLDPDNPENCRLQCTVSNCNSVLLSKKGSNLVAHFENKHALIFKQKFDEAAAKSETSSKELETRRLIYIQNLTKIVTVDGRPFLCLQDSGVEGLGARELEYLKDRGYGEGLTGNPPPAVMKEMHDVSSEIIKTIKLEVQNTLVSLMVDIGSRNKRSILGLAIQYMRNGRVIIRWIGMILLTESHTAENIKVEILACLQKFGIKASQLISITSDNASNMLAMIKLVNKCSDDNDDQSDDCDENDEYDELSKNVNNNLYDDEETIQAEINSIIDEFNLIQSMSDEEKREAEKRHAEVMEMLDDSSHYMELVKSLENAFAMETLNSHGIRCVLHTLQLAVKGALKGSQVQVLIDMCRVACKLLHRASYQKKLVKKNLKIVTPPLDNKTRWNSTYMMVTHFFCLSNASQLIFLYTLDLISLVISSRNVRMPFSISLV